MPRYPRPAASTSSLTKFTYQPLAERARRNGATPYRMDVGDTWMEPLEAARSENLLTADHPLLHAYATPHGEPDLLDAVEIVLTGRAGSPVSRECIQIVSGATSGLSNACQALLDPGDEVILPSPFWPLIRGIIASRGAVPVEVPIWTRLDEPEFDLEAVLESCVTPRTAAIYVNSPNNPTGRVLSTPSALALARVAERHDLWVFGDEVYEDLWYGDAAPRSLWALPELRERTVATHSMSKAYGMAGIRVGWTHGPASAMRAVRAVQTHQTYCAPRPMQFAAARALRGGDDWILALRRSYAESARMTAQALRIPVAEAGAFAFFDVAALVAPDHDALPFLERCVDAGVMLTPGIACGSDFGTWVRACFTTLSPSALERALERLRCVLDGVALPPPRVLSDEQKTNGV